MKFREAGILPLLVGWLAFSALAADVTGTWKGQVTDPQGNTHDVVFNFKADSNKLTGTVVGPPPGTPFTILNGKIDGDSLSFAIAIAAQAGTADTQKFSFAAKVTGNQIKGSATSSEGDTYSFTVTKLPAGAPEGAPQAAAPAPADLQPPNPRGTDPRPEDAQTAIVLTCPRCTGTMRIVACITPSAVIDQILTHLRTRTPVVGRPGARSPPAGVAAATPGPTWRPRAITAPRHAP